jgi:putative flippase GtrA
MYRTLASLINTPKVRYLIAGGWNTAFGYAAGVFLYYMMRDKFHIVIIGIVGNILAISMSFLTYKLFVFKTKGGWFREYLRAYVVYGGTAIVGIACLWIMVDALRLPFWLAQGLIVLVTVVVSYFGHSRFTFRKPT